MKSFTDQKVLTARQKAKRLRIVFLVFALVTMCDILTIALLQYAGIITERQKLLVFWFLSVLPALWVWFWPLFAPVRKVGPKTGEVGRRYLLPPGIKSLVSKCNKLGKAP